MRLVVTGAAGFVGSHLSEALLADGHLVTGVDCFSDYYMREAKESNLRRAAADPSFRLVELDMAEDDVSSVLADADGVFHLAAQPGVRGSWGLGFPTYVRNNITATQRLFEALRERPVPVVFASSSSVYGDAGRFPLHEEDDLRPISPYGVTKLAGEHLARLYGREHRIPVVSLRYFTVYGPRQRPDMAFSRFLRAAVEGRPVQVLGDGRQSRDFTFVGDAVTATMAALGGPPGAVFNVGGGSCATIRQVLELVSELAGRSIDVEYLPRAPGDVAHTGADTTATRFELGWRPEVDLRAGLEAQLRWVEQDSSRALGVR